MWCHGGPLCLVLLGVRDAQQLAVERKGREEAARMTGPSLTTRSLNAVKWSYAGNGVRSLLQLLIGVVLARLLGPQAFGIVAIAWLMIGIGTLFADFGFNAALIQSATLDQQDLNYAFTVQIGIAALLSGLGLILAHPIALFFHQPDAINVIRAMSMLFLIRGVGQTSTAILNRELKYKTTQVIDVVTYVIGFGLIGIPCAYLNLGAWSLVLAQLGQAALYTIIVVSVAKIPFQFSFRYNRSGIAKFGGLVVAANITSWAISNLDSAFVGHALGVTALGLYNRAFNLVLVPMGVATTSLQAVLFSAGSRAQGNHSRLRVAYLACTRAVSLLCFPVFLTMSVVPETIILGVYGERWHGAAILLTPLALAMPINALQAFAGPILMAQNRVDREISAQSFVISVAVPALYIASTYSTATVAWVVLFIYIVRALLLFIQVSRTISVSLSEMIKATTPGVVSAIIVAAPTYTVNYVLAAVPATPRLAIIVIFSGFMLALVAWLGGRWMLHGPLGELLNSSKRPTGGGSFGLG
jgi:PST family polysaccharide transporter